MSHDPHADPDMLRRPACDVHLWRAVDRRDDLLVCVHCRQTWSLDDDPDDGGRAA